jgi:hypothetical protein
MAPFQRTGTIEIGQSNLNNFAAAGPRTTSRTFGSGTHDLNQSKHFP